MPLNPAIATAAPFALLDALAIVLWTVGFVFEVVGDYRLTAFKENANNKGKVLNTGLWRYTRHPNYFGEF